MAVKTLFRGRVQNVETSKCPLVTAISLAVVKLILDKARPDSWPDPLCNVSSRSHLETGNLRIEAFGKSRQLVTGS